MLAGSCAIAEEARPTITVSAQSEYRVIPDEAIVAFSVSTQDKNLLTAKRQNDSLTTAVVAFLKSRTIASAEFKVTDLYIGPRYENRDNQHVFVDYQVRRSFEVRTGDFSKIDGIIDGVVQAGGDSVGVQQLSLQIRDQRRHQTEARRLAVEYAREKASHLAELNEMKLGSALMISEDVEYNQNAGGMGGFGGGIGLSAIETAPDLNTFVRTDSAAASTRAKFVFVSTRQEQAAQKDEANDDRGAREALLAPGQVSLNATVKIKFELLPRK